MSAKPESETFQNAYTDAPELHPNLILGSLQLLFWLFFHPSAWRNHVARIDPDLRPDFCLAELNRAQWRRPALRRLLILGYLVLPLLAGLLTGATYWLLGASGKSIMIGATAIVAFYVTFGLVLGIGFGIASSVAGGVAGVVATALASSLAFLVVAGRVDAVAVVAAGRINLGLSDTSAVDVPAFHVVLGVMMASAYGSAFGVAGGVARVVARWRSAYSLTRQIGGAIIGILIGVVVYGAALFVALGLAGGFMANPTFGVGVGVVIGLEYAVAVTWRTRTWRLGLAFGAAFGVAFAIAVFWIAYGSGSVAGYVTFAVLTWVSVCIGYAACFALSYVLAERVAGPWAGAVAGALTAGGAFAVFWIALGGYSLSLIWPLNLAFILLGLTLAWWRPVVFYPVLAAWNAILFRADERHAGQSPSLLRWHSAFWDEHQRLALIGLDDHLLLVAERDPVEYQAAVEYIATGRQRWAAQAAQIELDARQLAGCKDVASISRAHRGLAAGQLTGPANALLRSFSRISQDVEAALGQESSYNQRLALSAVEDRLDGLLRELTRSSERYAVRFRPVARQWRQIVADHVHQLAEVAETRQEIDSPYVIGVPLTEQQEIFVGRADVSARIESLLLDRRRPPLLLYGQRRMGKTSLLNNLGRLLPSTIVPLFVDLQGPASRASDHAGLLYNLARAMTASAAQERDLRLPPLSRDTLAVDPFTAFDEWLDEVEKTFGGDLALLAFDEFEALDLAFARGRFDEEAVLGMLRHLIQHRPRFKVLLTGSHTLDEVQRWSSYLINVQVVHISYLKEDEARQLIERPVQDFALRYEPEACQRVLNLTRGHPALVQLLCAEIVALKNEQEPAVRRLARLADVEAAVPEALSRGSFFFADIERNQVDAAGLSVLRYVAGQGEGAAVSREKLARQLPDPDDLDQALRLLTRRELIEAIDGGYRFQVELIRRWFARNL